MSTTFPTSMTLAGRALPSFPLAGRVLFTIADAMRMVRGGILPEDVSIELLNGAFVFRDCFDAEGRTLDAAGGVTVEGVRHNYVVTKLGRVAPRLESGRRHLRTQSTLVCSDTYAPIPDGVVLRGDPDRYASRLPSAADTLCVVEVADSSYERDTGEKLIGYARAAVAQYIVVNLRNRTAEIYTQPDASAGTYPPPKIISEADVLPLRIDDEEFFEVRLGDLLP